MIYTLIISLLIEKTFYLLRLQSFSFQIVSEFIDIFVKFSYFMSWDGAFDSLFCPKGRVFAPFKSCPGGGMVLDEIDTCIIQNHFLLEAILHCIVLYCIVL